MLRNFCYSLLILYLAKKEGMKPLELSKEYNYALDILEKTTSSVFITGKAGTGKSTLLKLFKSTTKKKTVVLAPTGIAALNVQGQTIHSFFGFPPRPDIKKHITRRKNHKLFKKIDLIIIDEISMVRADMLDYIDLFLRKNRDNLHEPFGGTQMVFFGDLFQLPPVVKREDQVMLQNQGYESPYFFSSLVFPKMELEMIELHLVYRQTNKHFLRILEAIRTYQFDRDDLEDLNDRFLGKDFKPSEFHITLSTRNNIVNKINTTELDRLDAVSYTFLGKVTGSFPESAYPADMVITLKEGARVMFTRNDMEGKYVNGTIGTVIFLTDKKIEVLVEEQTGKRVVIEVEQEEWEVMKYQLEEKTQEIVASPIGTFKQYPLKLAWAITIHKSQGKTFDRAIINLGGGAFEHGQTYVALSRCTTLQGIVLSRPIIPKDVILDERVVEFHEQYF